MLTIIQFNNRMYFLLKNGNILMMKKIFLILFLILIVIFAGSGGTVFIDRLIEFEKENCSQIIVFTYQDYDNLNTQKCGNFNMVKIKDIDELELIRNEDRLSENFYFQKSCFNIKNFLSDKKIVFMERVENLTLYYLYDFKLPKILNTDKGKFNIQIVVSENKVVLGYPCIMSSY